MFIIHFFSYKRLYTGMWNWIIPEIKEQNTEKFRGFTAWWPKPCRAGKRLSWCGLHILKTTCILTYTLTRHTNIEMVTFTQGRYPTKDQLMFHAYVQRSQLNIRNWKHKLDKPKHKMWGIGRIFPWRENVKYFSMSNINGQFHLFI